MKYFYPSGNRGGSVKKFPLRLSIVLSAKFGITKQLTHKLFFLLLIMMSVTGSIKAQVTGDFQPKNITGNWSNSTAWNIYNGAIWVAAGPGQIPAATASVFVLAGQTITVDITTAVCNDLHFSATGTTLKVIIQSTKILTIYGNLNQFDNTNIPFPSFGIGAKIIFAGSANQTITGSGPNTTLNDVEINKTGGTFTLPAVDTKYNVFTLTSGNLAGASGCNLIGLSSASIVNVNGGIWTQILGPTKINGGNGGIDIALSINGGSMTLATTNASVTGFNFSTVSIINGGILTLDNFKGPINITNSFSVDATSTLNTAMPLATTPTPPSMNFAGTVNYTHTGGSQTIINTPYGNLGLSGSVNKNTLADLNVSGNLNISGSAKLLLSPFTAFIGGNWTNYGSAGFTEGSSTVDFNGTGAQIINTAGGEDFFKVKKSGTGTLTLNSDARFASTSSELNISAGILDAGIYTLSGTAPTTLTMSGGTLKMAKLISPLPEFSNTSLTSGTIELNGTGAQILKGGFDYRNLSFSNSTSTTLSSNPTSITGNVYITGTATVDVASNTFGNAATNLIMDAGRFRMSAARTQPDIDGTYTVTGGVIEFYSSQLTRQTIKGKNAASADIIYNQIEVNGNNVGNSNSNILLNSNAGKFTVKTNGNFYINDNTIKSNAALNTTTIAVETGAVFSTGNNEGFSGFTATLTNNSSIHSNISSSGITLSGGSTVDYTGSGAQNISNQIPYQNFAVTAAAGIKKAPLTTLIIQGNITKSGTAFFAHNSSAVLLNGITAQSYSSANPIMTFYNITNSNSTGFTVNDSLAVVKQILFSPVSKLSLGTGDIILKSSDTITAAIGQVTAANIIYSGSGRFVIERYINIGIGHAKSWQFLAVPTSGQTINAGWQEGGVAGNNPKPGYGTQLTNPLGTGAGYDMVTIGTSIKTYLSSSGQWDAGPTNTGNAITNPKGYMLFVRGNRTVASGSGSAPTILRTRGTIFTDTQPPIPVTTSLYESIGNPYASAIDLRNVTKTNLTNDIYIWDPTLSGSYGVGGYRTLAWDGSNYLVTPQGGIYPGFVVDTLQSGQAFFVKSNGAANSSVQFTEAAKVTGVSRLINSPATRGFGNRVELLAVNLWLIQPSGKKTLIDGAIEIFAAKYSDKVDMEDGAKFMNPGENTGFITDGKLLAVERRKSPNANDTLNLNLTGTRAQAYNWIFNLKNMNASGRFAYLWDRYLNSKTALNLTGITSVDFIVESNTGSAAADRFKIVFSKKERLPVMLISIAAVHNKDKSININWKTENEINLEGYSIERSSNGTSFVAVGIHAPGNNNGDSVTYFFKDVNPPWEDNYYRIKALSHSGPVLYSATVKIPALKLPASISVYPNPVVDKKMIVEFSSQRFGNYQVELINQQGQVIYRASVAVSSNNFTKIFVLAPKIAAGNYQLSITGANGSKTVQQVLMK